MNFEELKKESHSEKGNRELQSLHPTSISICIFEFKAHISGDFLEVVISRNEYWLKVLR